MKKWFKILGYALTLSIPLALLITMAFSKVFLGKLIIINDMNILLFLSSTILITIFVGYWLSESDRRYLKYDEVNIEIMDGIFIPKPIKNKFQYGSSWFLEKEEIEKKFSYNVIEDNKMIRLLLADRKISEEIFEKYKFEKGGISLGLCKENGKEKIYYNDDDTHSIILGATRSGKGRTVLLQTIGIQGLAGENMILSDPKGELFCYTNEFLKNLGYEVIALDFEEPEKSNSYNFLQNVIDYVNEGDMTRAIDSVEDIVDMLVQKGSNEPIWENGEKSILAFAILLIVIENKDKPEYQNLTNVYNFLSKMCISDENGKIPLNKYIQELPDDHPAKMKASISLVAPEKTRGSFFTSALSTLRLFASPFIYEMSKQTDFNINDSSKKRAIFIILPDQKQTYNSLAGLFISQYYNSLIKNAKANGNRLERRVNFNLDEFGNYPAINGMESKMTVSAGYGIRFNLFIQSFAQLKSVYDEDVARVLKDNAETLIYLRSKDTETLREVSERLGTYTVLNVTESNGKGSFTSSTSYVERPLLNYKEVEKIKRPNTLVLKDGENIIFYAPDLSNWFFNKIFGLGDKEHNRQVILERQEKRPKKLSSDIKMKLWNRFYKSLEEEIGDYEI
ncbi:VirD4-like conjugal transfer protein, CD1115 family [[Clostridium] colinum]|uniref:VirD4-like conjugal transfer protein, CD1115 family n=1 Tax=[Clostridium] colinum TaxID=36835 RepID=UPI0020246CCF|nr:type IV secretory system conjugative DNA transfer family protein [[Clostridium] colinum]